MQVCIHFDGSMDELLGKALMNNGEQETQAY